MILDEAMYLLDGFATEADCKKPPNVRLIFNDPEDQARFKLLIVQKMKPVDAVTAPIGSEKFELAGLTVELCNKEIGTRPIIERIVEHARRALKEGSKPTVTPPEILAMRQALSDLLGLMKV